MRKWKSQRRKPYWKDRPGFCQDCGHMERTHKEYIFGIMCLNEKCNCEEYIAVPEHDFSQDQEYDRVAYGEYEQPKVEMKQRLISGMGHNDACLSRMKLKHSHRGDGCQCHEI